MTRRTLFVKVSLLLIYSYVPITKSAIKAMRSSARKRVINIVRIDKYKDAIKAVRRAVGGKKKDEAARLLQTAYAQIDKAAKKHVIHKNKAARLKSRLAQAIAKIYQNRPVRGGFFIPGVWCGGGID